MNYRLIIAVMAVMLAFTACHKKKQQQPAPVPAADTTATPQPVVAPDTAVVPVEPAPVVEPVTEPAVAPADTVLEPLVPEVDTVEVGWKPIYQSAFGRGTVTVNYKQHRLASPATVTYLADSIIIASVQPMLGIEMYRIEAHKTFARGFEKLNRRYVEMTYEEISAEAKRKVDFAIIQQFVEEVGLTFPIGQDTTLRFSGVEANLKLQARTINQPVSAAPMSTYGYNRTTLKAILSK